MLKLAFFVTLVGFLVSATGISSLRDGNKLKPLQLILSRTQRDTETMEGLNMPEARSKRGLSTIIITDEPDPITIVGFVDWEIINDGPDPLDRVKLSGQINGRLENVRSTANLRDITDGSDPVEVEGKLAGKVRVGDDATVSKIVEAKAHLVVEVKAAYGGREPISVTGHLKGTLEIDTSQRDLREVPGIIIDDTGMIRIQGQITGVIVYLQ